MGVRVFAMLVVVVFLGSFEGTRSLRGVQSLLLLHQVWRKMWVAHLSLDGFCRLGAGRH
jgi:hypothetical protein